MQVMYYFIFTLVIGLLFLDCRKKIRQVLSRCFLISLSLSFLYQLMVTIDLGYIDPFFPIAVFIQLLLGALGIYLGGFIKLMFTNIRNRRAKQS